MKNCGEYVLNVHQVILFYNSRHQIRWTTPLDRLFLFLFTYIFVFLFLRSEVWVMFWCFDCIQNSINVKEMNVYIFIWFYFRIENGSKIVWLSYLVRMIHDRPWSWNKLILEHGWLSKSVQQKQLRRNNNYSNIQFNFLFKIYNLFFTILTKIRIVVQLIYRNIVYAAFNYQ